MGMLNWVDWLIIAILGISSLISLKRGLVKETLSLAIWLTAFLVASWFSLSLAPVLSPWVESFSLRQMLAFAILFLISLILGGIVSYLTATLIKVTGLTGTDRILGMIFGLVRGAVIVMVLVIYSPKLVDVSKDQWWQHSVLIPHFQSFEIQFTRLLESLYNQVKDNWRTPEQGSN
ncbi:MAG: membrane protein required for colicin V production [Cellvibrionaceae bacterium]|jgi:membrane protein required for colicin V production